MRVLALLCLSVGVLAVKASGGNLCKLGAQQSPISFENTVIRRDASLRPIQLSSSCRIGADSNEMHLEKGVSGMVGVLKSASGGGACTVRDPLTASAIPFHHMELHSGPEHSFSSITADMEVQLYFQDATASIALAIPVVCLSKKSQETKISQFLDMFVQLSSQSIRRYNDTSVVRQFNTHPHGILHLIPVQDRGYVSYSGSLTSAPCSEGVQWYVFTSPLHVRIDLDRDETALLTAEKLKGQNHRAVQPLNGRLLTRYVDPSAHAESGALLDKKRAAQGHKGDRILGSPTAVLAALGAFGATFALALYLFQRFSHAKGAQNRVSGGEPTGEQNHLARAAPPSYGSV